MDPNLGLQYFIATRFLSTQLYARNTWKTIRGLLAQNYKIGSEAENPRDPRIIRFDALPACDGRTDGRTNGRTNEWTRRLYLCRALA